MISRLRPFLVVLHRYVGLAIALFLLVAGLSGSLLAFYEPLEAALWPALKEVVPPLAEAKPLDAFTLSERALAHHPQTQIDSLELWVDSHKPYIVELEPRQTTDSVAAATAGEQEIALDPYTGDELGIRHHGDLSQGLKNLMPFLYELHYSLALGSTGMTVMGIIAMLWTLDCFVGLALTLPRGTPFFAKWAPAWMLKRQRLVYDLHRAGGLWIWLMLLVLAWSSVSFNLRPVYSTVMHALSGYHDAYAALPDVSKPAAATTIDWRAARSRGAQLMAEQAASHGFRVEREDGLYFMQKKNALLYSVISDRDIQHRYGATHLVFDATTGAMLGLELPTGDSAGTTFTTWITALHMALVGGLAFKVFVSACGLTVAALSSTGAVLWLRKRRVHQRAPSIRPRTSPAMNPLSGEHA